MGRYPFYHLNQRFEYSDGGKAKPEQTEQCKPAKLCKEIQALLKTAVLCIACPEKHFAEVIRSSIVGLGTDEDSLTREIVTRAKVDMVRIKEVYLELNKESVKDAVIGDTSGDYKDFLLTLLGRNSD